MKYLFQATVDVDGRPVAYKIYLLTNGSHYAESMNHDFDNFILRKINGNWSTSLNRNQYPAEQIGVIIEIS